MKQYFDLKTAPMKYHKMRLYFSLPLSAAINALVFIVYLIAFFALAEEAHPDAWLGIALSICALLLAIASSYACIKMHKMSWRGVKALLASGIIVIIYQWLAFFYDTQINGTSPSSPFVNGPNLLMPLFIYLEYRYYKKRQPLFTGDEAPIQNDPLASPSSSLEATPEVPRPTTRIRVQVKTHADAQALSPEAVPTGASAADQTPPPVEPAPKRQQKWLSITCGVLAALSIILTFGCIILSRDVRALNSAAEALQKDLTAAENARDVFKNQLDNANTELSRMNDKVDRLNARVDEYMFSDFFLSTVVGFTFDSDPTYYHTFHCPIFDEEELFRCHNIEFCELLGYKPCSCND